jgi:malate synthase
LAHGVCSPDEVNAALSRMAEKVDAQNAGNPAYQPMAGRETQSLSFRAACALTFQGAEQPNGYIEPLLHDFRSRVKYHHDS